MRVDGKIVHDPKQGSTHDHYHFEMELPNDAKARYVASPRMRGDYHNGTYYLIEKNSGKVMGMIIPGHKAEEYKLHRHPIAIGESSKMQDWKFVSFDKQRRVDDRLSLSEQEKAFGEKTKGKYKRPKRIGIESLRRIGKSIYSANAAKYYQNPEIDSRLKVYYIDNKDRALRKAIEEKRLKDVPEGYKIMYGGEEAWIEED